MKPLNGAFFVGFILKGCILASLINTPNAKKISFYFFAPAVRLF